MKKKQSKQKTSSRLDLSKDTTAYQPLYYDGEQAHIGDLVRYHNLIDVANMFDGTDKEVYLLAGISEEMVGIKQDTDDPMHPVEDLQWLADIRNNKNSHIVNLSYLVKVKGE